MVGKACMAETADTYPGIIARNVAVLEYEKFIHRMFYPYIIHPYSRFRVNWERSYLMVIPLRMTIASYVWVIYSHQSLTFKSTCAALKIINFIDVFVNFFTGYIENKTEVAVLDPRKIARKYFLRYFAVDFIPCLPVEGILYVFFGDKCDWNREHMDKCMIIAQLGQLSHLLRLFAFYRYARNLAKILLWNQFLLAVYVVGITMYCTLIIANDFYSASYFENGFFLQGTPLSHLSDLEKTYRYIDDMIKLVLNTLYFDTDIPEGDLYGRPLLLVVSFFCGIVFTSYAIKYVVLELKAKEKLMTLESTVQVFVRRRHLSSLLAQKTLLYFQVLLDKKHRQEDELFNFVPDSFKADMFLHLCLPLLKNFRAFEDLPKYVLRRLAECMKYQLYLPNEVIMSKDDIRLSMYFIHSGTAALYSSSHVELYHFEAGSTFNGRNLISGGPIVYTYAISIEVSEIYQLTQEDFLDIMKPYPKLLKDVQDKVQKEKMEGATLLD